MYTYVCSRYFITIHSFLTHWKFLTSSNALSLSYATVKLITAIWERVSSTIFGFFFREVKQENDCCICCGIASESLRLQRCLFLTGLTTVPRFLAGMKEQPLRPRGATSTVWYREPLPAKAGWMLLHLLGKFARQVPEKGCSLVSLSQLVTRGKVDLQLYKTKLWNEQGFASIELFALRSVLASPVTCLSWYLVLQLSWQGSFWETWVLIL